MTIQAFWAQDQAILSLELFGLIIMVGLVVLGARFVSTQTKVIPRIRTLLGGRTGLYVFKIVRLLIALAGIMSIWVTMWPGLTPFADQVDQNLELGVLVLPVILWPLMVSQVFLYGWPMEKYLAHVPIIMWWVMLAGAILYLEIDNSAIRFVYN